MRRLLLPGALLLLFAAQCFWFIGTQSLTADEPMHLVAGVEAWRYGCFRCFHDSPPLARLAFGLPLLAANTKMNVNIFGLAISTTPSPQEIAWLARPVSVLFGIALGILLWITARALFSEGGANLALALMAFSPSLIAHFSLATTDGLAVLMIFATAAAFTYWRSQPSPARTTLLGAVMGGMLLAKFNTPPLLALALVLALLTLPRGRWRVAVALVVVAGFVVWAGYFFHFSGSPFPPEHSTHIPLDGARMIYFATPVPAREFWEGLVIQGEHLARGHMAYMFGKLYPNGAGWTYFPVTMLLKWPPVVLLLFLAALIVCWKDLRDNRAFLWMAPFPVLLFALSLASTVNIGDRHILPVYPFLLLTIASLWQRIAAQRWGVWLACGVVLLTGADVARYAPDYLSYFTPAIPPSRAHLYLADSNLDWGQGLIALRAYEDRHPGRPITLMYFGSVQPSLYGIHAEFYDPSKPVHDTVILNANCLAWADSGIHNRDFCKPYRERQPTEILNHSLFVYEK